MTRLFIDLSDGLKRTYDVGRYVIEDGVLRLFDDPAEGVLEQELVAFAVGGWLRLERELPDAEAVRLGAGMDSDPPGPVD